MKRDKDLSVTSAWWCSTHLLLHSSQTYIVWYCFSWDVFSTQKVYYPNVFLGYCHHLTFVSNVCSHESYFFFFSFTWYLNFEEKFSILINAIISLHIHLCEQWPSLDVRCPKFVVRSIHFFFFSFKLCLNFVESLTKLSLNLSPD